MKAKPKTILEAIRAAKELRNHFRGDGGRITHPSLRHSRLPCSEMLDYQEKLINKLSAIYAEEVARESKFI